MKMYDYEIKYYGETIKRDIFYGHDSISEESIQKHIKNSSILVFTSMDGIIGKGVYQEIEAAEEAGIKVYYLHKCRMYSDPKIYRLTQSTNDRLYATVDENFATIPFNYFGD